MISSSLSKAFMTLLSMTQFKSWSQFQYLLCRHQRQDGCDHTQKKSQSSHGALFMVGGFALSSMSYETLQTAGVSAEVHLPPEKQPPLRDEKGWFSQKKPTQSGNTDDRTHGIKEWSANRKLEFRGMIV